MFVAGAPERSSTNFRVAISSRSQIHAVSSTPQLSIRACVEFSLNKPMSPTAPSSRIKAVGLTACCAVIAGDFFHAVPDGGDAYILKHVIHDWDDGQATKILENCRRAMGATGRLTRIVPTPVGVSMIEGVCA
jgi:O-methyltransferase